MTDYTTLRPDENTQGEGSFVKTLQGQTGEGFAKNTHVHKDWYAKTQSFEEGMEVLEKGVAEREDLIREGRIIDEGDCVRFLTDVRFKGPSRAASIVLGRGGTGLVYWKDCDGKTLAELKNGRSRPQAIAGISLAATDNQLLSVFGLNAPGANKRPIFIRIEGKEYPAKNWRELYVHACEHVAMRYPKEWDEVLLSEVFMGRKSRAFGLNGGGMRSPKKISRGFIEVHFSGDDMIKSLQKLFKFVGIDPAQVEYAMLSKS
jgi:hypothetical protein